MEPFETYGLAHYTPRYAQAKRAHRIIHVYKPYNVSDRVDWASIVEKFEIIELI